METVTKHTPTLPAAESGEAAATKCEPSQSENPSPGSSSFPQSHRLRRVVRTTFALSGIWCSCTITGIIALSASLPWFQALCLPASLCLLSLCWHPQVQVYVVRSSDGRFRGRWKATCVYTVLKLVAVLLGLNLVMLIRVGGHGFLDSSFFYTVWEGLLTCREPYILYPLIALFVGSFLVHTAAYVGAALCLARSSLTLPSLFSTPLAIAVIVCFCIPTSPSRIPALCVSKEPALWCACGLALITWVAPYVIHGTKLNRNPQALLQPYDNLFIQPAWNALFLEQHMFLSYRADGMGSKGPSVAEVLSPQSVTDTGIDPDSKVFICTTMYREADFEMRRLLKSLSKISKSKRLLGVYMEAHVFLDNGAKDLHITDFASQLVSLLQNTLGVTSKDASAYTTPYGAQLSWRLPAGIPFFIHLKDSGKVKPKKRWSQVMYMSYILNQRILTAHAPTKHAAHFRRGERSRGSIEESVMVGYVTEKEWQKNSVCLSTDGDTGNDTPSPITSAVNTFESQERSYLTESKKKLALLCKDTPYHFGALHKSDTFTTDVSSCSAETQGTTTDTTLQAISSDQGIGHSDDVTSLSSSASSKEEEEGEDTESSSVSASRPGSGRGQPEGREEIWQDYEGDISSNNENSIPGGRNKTRPLLEGIRDIAATSEDDAEQTNDLRPPPYDNLPHPMFVKQGHKTKCPAISGTHFRPNFVRGHYKDNCSVDRKAKNVSSARSNKGGRQQRKEGRQKASANPDKPDATYRQWLEEGHTNLGFQSCSTSDKLDNLKPLPSVSPTASSPAAETVDVEVTDNKKEIARSRSINKESENQPPASELTSVLNSDTAVGDNVYILATDADMRFSADSVVDLLSLCHYDQRIGGACGRTHPIGQRMGPLVWYQKFEYAKGGYKRYRICNLLPYQLSKEYYHHLKGSMTSLSLAILPQA